MTAPNFKVWIDDDISWALRRCISRNCHAAPDKDKIHLDRAYAAIVKAQPERIDGGERNGDLFNENSGKGNMGC